MYISLISSWLKILKNSFPPLSSSRRRNRNAFDESLHIPHTPSQHPALIVNVYPNPTLFSYIFPFSGFLSGPILQSAPQELLAPHFKPPLLEVLFLCKYFFSKYSLLKLSLPAYN